MELRKIAVTSPSDPLFPAIWELFEESFPPEERRTRKRAQEVMEDSRLRLWAFLDGTEFVGAIWAWDFGTYLFMEFFSVREQFRCGGYGTKIFGGVVREAYAQGKAVVLEIDEMIDEISIRRFGFYERMGFVMNEIEHISPRYDSPQGTMTLHVLSYKEPISGELYDDFYDKLVRVIIGSR